MKSPAVVPLIAVCCGWISLSAAPPTPSDIELVVTQIAERVARYYRDFGVTTLDAIDFDRFQQVWRLLDAEYSRPIEG